MKYEMGYYFNLISLKILSSYILKFKNEFNSLNIINRLRKDMYENISNK